MVRAENLRASDANYASFSPPEIRAIIESGLRTERFEIIPLERTVTDFSLVDDQHAENIGASMAEERGQTTPILVRVRIDEEDEIKYDIIDGFHRRDGARRQNQPTIKATVLYDCSDDEMYNRRILAASSVQSVQFPRIAEWMRRSFETTEWSKKGLTVAQVFGLAISDRKTTYSGLSPEELQRLKEWARGKCKDWDRGIATIYQILRVVEDANPELVKRVRNAGGGRDSARIVTPARIKAVVQAFPGEKNFRIQEVVINFALEHRLSSKAIDRLIENTSLLISPEMDEGMVRQILEENMFQASKVSGEVTVYEEEEESSEADLFREDKAVSGDDGLHNDNDLSLNSPELAETLRQLAAQVAPLVTEGMGHLDVAKLIADAASLQAGNGDIGIEEDEEDFEGEEPGGDGLRNLKGPTKEELLAIERGDGDEDGDYLGFPFDDDPGLSEAVSNDGRVGGTPLPELTRSHGFGRGKRMAHLIDDPSDLTSMRQQIVDLQRALEIVTTGQHNRVALLIGAPYLSEQERRVFTALFVEGICLDDLPKIYGITPARAFVLIESALRKRDIAAEGDTSEDKDPKEAPGILRPKDTRT